MITAGADFPIHRVAADLGTQAERLAQARDVYTRAIVEVDIAPHPDGPFGWRGASRKLPGLGLATAVCSGVRIARKPAPDEADELILTAVVAGRLHLRSAGRDTVVRAGEIAMTGSRDAATYDCDRDCRLLDLRIPRPPAIGHLDLAFGASLAAAEPLSMLAKYADVLLDSDGHERSDTLSLAVAHVHEIVDLVLDVARGMLRQKVRRPGVVRLRAIKADIVENASSRDLTMAAIAARHRVTPRYVRKLLETEGLTFSEFVLGERLARAHRMLTDPRRCTETISAIAFACGFGDLSYFNRVFRRHNGATPTEVREAARRSAAGAGVDAGQDPGAKCGAESA